MDLHIWQWEQFGAAGMVWCAGMFAFYDSKFDGINAQLDTPAVDV